jgi:D-cysteine desulfhydrase
LDKLVGAELSFYPNTEYTARASEILEHWRQFYADQGHKAFMIPVGASDGLGLWGYIAACQELAADFASHAIAPKHIVCATGSGGTQGGLTVGNELFQLGARVWGVNVCDDEAYFKAKVLEDMQQWQQWYQQALAVDQLPINVIDGYVGAGYARASKAVFATIRQLAKTEGLVLDPVYTGKAFHGMLDQYRQGLFDDAEDIVFVHTGGVFGLFPQRQQLFSD